MSTLRIIYDNALARASSLVASSEAGALVAAQLKTDIKSAVWRSVGTTASLTLQFPNTETFSGVALPYSNMDSNTTMRVRVYTNVADTTPVFDTGVLPAVCYSALAVWGFAQPLGVNSFAYGGATCPRLWFSEQSGKKVLIDLVDTGNASGYLEAGRLCLGRYWSPLDGADFGASVLPQDTTVNYRSAAGDLLSDRGTKSRKIPIQLSYMVESDRAQLMDILLGNGMSQPMLFSLFPDQGGALEHHHMLYGKLSALSAVAIASALRYSSPVEIEEV